MTLVDTSKWINYLRRGDATLDLLMMERSILSHPLVTGELAVGMLKDRVQFLRFLTRIAPVTIATSQEVMQFVEDHALYGRGISIVDAHLLVSCKLAAGTTLWTDDRRLKELAQLFGIAFQG